MPRYSLIGHHTLAARRIEGCSVFRYSLIGHHASHHCLHFFLSSCLVAKLPENHEERKETGQSNTFEPNIYICYSEHGEYQILLPPIKP